MLLESETIREYLLLTSSFSEHLIVDLARLNLPWACSLRDLEYWHTNIHRCTTETHSSRQVHLKKCRIDVFTSTADETPKPLSWIITNKIPAQVVTIHTRRPIPEHPRLAPVPEQCGHARGAYPVEGSNMSHWKIQCQKEKTRKKSNLSPVLVETKLKADVQNTALKI